MYPDLDRYLPLMESYDLTEDEKRLFLQALWATIENFMDRAFNCDSTQLIIEGTAKEQKSSGHESSNCLGFNKQSSIKENS